MSDLSAHLIPLGIGLLGLALSIAGEALLTPRPPLRGRPPASWAVHAGLWAVLFGLLLALTGRPWFALVNALSLCLLIVLVSNAKYHSLREPFVCADFEYFSDAVRYPRLYLPFFGIGRAVLLAGLYLGALALGLYWEPFTGTAARLGLLLAAGGLGLLGLAGTRTLRPSFAPDADLLRFGLAGALWSYFWAARQPVAVSALPTPFAPRRTGPRPTADLVVVQSESFFDARRLWPGIRPQVLGHYDRLRDTALARGRLQVAAWGANTVRTEFAFLSGLPGAALGVHRFNPYRILARQGIPSLASELRRQGYRTICIHPYVGGFYGRDRVLPALGFDEFIDLRSFTAADRSGPYVGDLALAAKIVERLATPSDQPLYIHAITMENHGPLHLETVADADLPTWFDRPLPAGCRDLAAYVRHLGNADRMLALLQERLREHRRPAGLCFFGDHVPILPEVYRALGTPDGDTDYLLWHNRDTGSGVEQPLTVEALPLAVLDMLEHASRSQQVPA